MAPLEIIENSNLIIRVLLLLFGVSVLTQLGYYLLIFSKFGKKKIHTPLAEPHLPPVSVVICARNEAENLRSNLPSILEQDYPEFEVIVVDHCSVDGTDEILSDFQSKYPRLRTTSIRKEPLFPKGKKLALTLGIKAARHAILLLTDADCKPAGMNWIRLMAANYLPETGIVLGIGLFHKGRGFVNLLSRFEACFIALQYISLANYGRPYMGVGRNLSYRKEIFFANKGFASHLNLVSGDDDIFVNETASAGNTVVEIDPDSFTYSDSERTLGDWIRQKKRHLTTASFYQQSTQMILGMEYFSRMLMIVSFVWLIIMLWLPVFLISVYILMVVIKLIIYIIAFGRMKEKNLYLAAIFFEPIMPFLYGGLHFINFIERKRSRWN